MAVQSTSGATGNSWLDSISQKSTDKKTASSMEEAQDRFLTLLVTQLKNQDPLNPMDNAQMTSQLAQMSTVSGIEKLNTTLNSLVTSLGDSQAIQAFSMIGKNVLVEGSTLALVEGASFGAVNLPSNVDNVKITIMDKDGKVVQTQELDRQSAGNMLFSWDGKNAEGEQLADGTYSFKVEAIAGNSTVKATALQVGMVSALVRSSNGGFLLDLGALGTVDFSKVQQIL